MILGEHWFAVTEESGVVDLRLTGSAMQAATDYRQTWTPEQRNRTELRVACEPATLSSERPFELTGLEIVDGSVDLVGVVHVVRGCFEVLRVPTWTVRDSRAGGASEPFPTRIFNPPRQNLSFSVLSPREPFGLRVHWRHVGPPVGGSR